MSLEYNISLEENSLIKDISKRLSMRFLGLNNEDSEKFAKQSIALIKDQGTLALYDGLVELGKKYAIKAYEQSKKT